MKRRTKEKNNSDKRWKLPLVLNFRGWQLPVEDWIEELEKNKADIEAGNVIMGDFIHALRESYKAEREKETGKVFQDRRREYIATLREAERYIASWDTESAAKVLNNFVGSWNSFESDHRVNMNNVAESVERNADWVDKDNISEAFAVFKQAIREKSGDVKITAADAFSWLIDPYFYKKPGWTEATGDDSSMTSDVSKDIRASNLSLLGGNIYISEIIEECQKAITRHTMEYRDALFHLAVEVLNTIVTYAKENEVHIIEVLGAIRCLTSHTNITMSYGDTYLEVYKFADAVTSICSGGIAAIQAKVDEKKRHDEVAAVIEQLRGKKLDYYADKLQEILDSSKVTPEVRKYPPLSDNPPVPFPGIDSLESGKDNFDGWKC